MPDKRPHARLVLACGLVAALATASAFAVCTESPANVFTCNTSGPNPDPDGIQQDSNDNNLTITMLPGSGIDTTDEPGLDEDGMEIGDGDLVITLTSASVVGQDHGIDLGSGSLELTITDSSVLAITNGGMTKSASDSPVTVVIENSEIASVENNVLDVGSDTTTRYTVRDSVIQVLEASGLDDAISLVGDAASATILLENSRLISGNSNDMDPKGISLGAADDTVTIGNGVSIRTRRPGNVLDEGITRCGGGNDTLVFAMSVPPDQIGAVRDALATAGPTDSVTINGETYSWEACENIVDETRVRPLTEPRSIPVNPTWVLLLLVLFAAALARRGLLMRAGG